MMRRWAPFGLLVFLLAAGLFAASCSNTKEEANPGSTQTGGAVPGVTDTEILLGTHMPLSNSPAATYGVIADGMRAYFDYVNSQGGVYGRRIKFVVGDDHYSPPDAVEVVRNLVEQQGVFAIVGGLGDPTHLAVMNYLAEKGVPDLFLGGGVPIFTDPIVKTRFEMTTDYVTEAKIMGAYVVKNFAGQREGILYQNDDAGRTGLEAAKELLKNSD
jgi:branched-chain amino acid transport system substrate-binding protein